MKNGRRRLTGDRSWFAELMSGAGDSGGDASQGTHAGRLGAGDEEGADARNRHAANAVGIIGPIPT